MKSELYAVIIRNIEHYNLVKTAFWFHSTTYYSNKNYNHGQKVLGTVMQYSKLPVISGFPHSTVFPFWNFLAVLPPPTLYKAETRRKLLDICVQRFLWSEEGWWGKGVGIGKRPRTFCKSVPRALVRDCRLPESSGKVEELKQSQSVGTSIEIERVRNGVIILHVMVNIVLTLQFIDKI